LFLAWRMMAIVHLAVDALGPLLAAHLTPAAPQAADEAFERGPISLLPLMVVR